MRINVLFYFILIFLQTFAFIENKAIYKDGAVLLERRFLSAPSKLMKYKNRLKLKHPSKITKVFAIETSFRSQFDSFLASMRDMLVIDKNKKYNDKIWMNRFG